MPSDQHSTGYGWVPWWPNQTSALQPSSPHHRGPVRSASNRMQVCLWSRTVLDTKLQLVHERDCVICGPCSITTFTWFMLRTIQQSCGRLWRTSMDSWDIDLVSLSAVACSHGTEPSWDCAFCKNWPSLAISNPCKMPAIPKQIAHCDWSRICRFVAQDQPCKKTPPVSEWDQSEKNPQDDGRWVLEGSTKDHTEVKPRDQLHVAFSVALPAEAHARNRWCQWRPCSGAQLWHCIVVRFHHNQRVPTAGIFIQHPNTRKVRWQTTNSGQSGPCLFGHCLHNQRIQRFKSSHFWCSVSVINWSHWSWTWRFTITFWRTHRNNIVFEPGSHKVAWSYRMRLRPQTAPNFLSSDWPWLHFKGHRLVSLDEAIEPITARFGVSWCDHFTAPAAVSTTVLDKAIKCDVFSRSLRWKLNKLFTRRNTDGWNLCWVF